MYDLNKIIIMGDYDLSDEDELETVVMKTIGMKVTDLLYINKKNFIYDELKDELKSELYDDMYDDTLKIKTSDAYNGEDALTQVATFIDDVWDPDSLLYYYNASEENIDFLKDELKKYNGRIYLDEYYNIFTDGKDIDKDIIDIMKEQGLNTSNMLKDSSISFIYFLHGLVEKMINK